VIDDAVLLEAFTDAVAVADAPELQAVIEAAIKQVSAIFEAFLIIVFPPYLEFVTANIPVE
jgi:hypothetical protein